MNLGSDSLQKIMEEHHENIKMGSQSYKRLKRKKKMEKAANLIAERWRARQAGELARDEVEKMKMANMMLTLLPLQQKRRKTARANMQHMYDVHHSFQNGPGSQRSQSVISTARSSTRSHRTNKSQNIKLNLDAVHDAHPEVVEPKSFDELTKLMTKAELRGVPGHHGKKTFDYYEGVSETNQRFMFGSPSIAEGQIYSNIMKQSKNKLPINAAENGEADGKIYLVKTIYINRNERNLESLEKKFVPRRTVPSLEIANPCQQYASMAGKQLPICDRMRATYVFLLVRLNYGNIEYHHPSQKL